MYCRNGTELEQVVWSTCQGKPLRGRSPGLNDFTFSGFRGLALLNSSLKPYVSIQVSARPLSLSGTLLLQVCFKTPLYHSVIKRKVKLLEKRRWWSHWKLHWFTESIRLWFVEWPLSSLVESHAPWVSVDCHLLTVVGQVSEGLLMGHLVCLKHLKMFLVVSPSYTDN